ncbi:MAG: formyl transferase [Pseudomonadota bacterium]
MRTLVLVSPDKSDIFFANQLAKTLNVVGIVVENQTPERDRSSLARKSMKYLSRPGVFVQKVLDVLDRRFIDKHQDYNRPENSLDFGEEGLGLQTDPDVPILYTRGVNAINDPECVQWIRERQPEVIAVCGASILRTELLAVPEQGVLNLHGGLSQFYRGLFTTDWAIHNAEPECVGATVHYVSEGVDDGDVVYQGRPVIEQGDHPNSLYEKVVRLGVQMMVRAISDLETSTGHAVELASRGNLYLNSMFDVRAKRRTWRQIRNGVIDDYLNNQAERDARIKPALINDFDTNGGQG